MCLVNHPVYNITYYEILYFIYYDFGTKIQWITVCKIRLGIRLIVTFAPPRCLKYLLKLTYMFKGKSLMILNPVHSSRRLRTRD